MSIELARTKLRGVYAIVAGAILLLGIPLFQSVFLAPVGYVTAIEPAAHHGDFAPLLAWLGQHAGADVAFHILQLLPFLAVIMLPGALRRALWPRGNAGGLLMALSGQLGFACYALAIVVGIVSSIASANSFATAPNDRAATVTGFVHTFAFTTLLAQIIGGLLVALSLALASWRGLRTRLLIPWLSLFGLLVAALLAITAIQFSVSLTQVETTLAPFSFATLALWLIFIGTQLAWLRALPTTESAQPAMPISDANRNTGATATDHQ